MNVPKLIKMTAMIFTISFGCLSASGETLTVACTGHQNEIPKSISFVSDIENSMAPQSIRNFVVNRLDQTQFVLDIAPRPYDVSTKTFEIIIRFGKNFGSRANMKVHDCTNSYSNGGSSELLEIGITTELSCTCELK